MSKDYTNRILLISDMHYTTEETYKELKAKYPNAEASAAAGNALGYTQKEKIGCIMNDINNFTENKTIDAVLVLGDLSIDDYSYRNLPENYCQKFKEECMDQLTCPSYAIAGNHDSYPNNMWKDMFGYNRQFSVKIKDAAFIMLDTFDSEPATSAAGSPYIGIDMEFLQNELEKYPTEKIFLCAHYIGPDVYTDEFVKLLNENKRIVCLFDAHTHISRVHLPHKDIKQYQINTGGYGYQGECINNRWVFDRFDEAWAWGYQVLEWNDHEAHVYHVKPSRRYIGSGVEIQYDGTVENELTIIL